MIKNFPHYPQQNSVTCGLTCIKIIAKYYNKIIDITPYYKNLTSKGYSIYDLCQTAENIGFRSVAYSVFVSDLESLSRPVIIHWDKNHYAVLYKVKKNRFFISDPAKGLVDYDINVFRRRWLDENNTGKIIILEVSEKFHELKNSRSNYLAAIDFLVRHLSPYRKNLSQLLLVMIVMALIYASLPFITRSIIDVGIQGHDFDFITIVLIANISLLIFKSVGEWIRASISMHIASRIKISIVTDYLIKVFSLPVNFIDSMLMGDIMQRSKDQERIQQFISNSAISIFMSTLIIIIYGIILFAFDGILFLIFLFATLLYILWIMFFYQIRKKMDISYYQLMGENQSSWIEILKNFEDIKLNNYSLSKRWKWEKIQGSLYKIEVKLLNIDRMQQLGADFINGMKDIGLTFYGAYLVIQGDLSLGTLISIQFIIGQLGTPVMELINFIKMAQSAFISFMRVNDINNMPEEQVKSKYLIGKFDKENNDIIFKNVSFRYKGASKVVLYNLSFTIPENKTTAIVGLSGSGKSTILKLLSKVYDEYSGEIYLGKSNLRSFDNEFIRQNTGTVFQESTLYNDTILNNIVLSDEHQYSLERVEEILPLANLKEEIYLLPEGLNTRLSEGGKGLSQGQKQRLLLARAFYKRPKFLLLDEVTNAIDSYSENKILDVFANELKKETIVLVSHKLSTVKCADFIIMIDRGMILEYGSYDELVQKKTFFYNLFKSQIDGQNK
ncbi:peptidase domain-containing ABC transporter [Flavobacterium sp. TAB 87]|uniref:peptidase domain-containing ABC transporter n=1 Tax=Flavobacterium sp. TAB 87 TaxID=1729581 RepID=UPI00076D6F13|nr:peptidase domain-containing ABC transporter [Flavobacterium sp. TAB 87]KVV16349.1 Alpha-hemolysin translocation ATP-binding protein HlyB [Flavobacterium sp. TAB 87]